MVYYDDAPPQVPDERPAVAAEEFQAPVFLERSPEVRQRIRILRGQISFIYTPQYQIEKRAYLERVEREGLLMDMFHRAQLLTPPSSQDSEAWKAYDARFSFLLSTSAADELYDCLRRGFRIVTLFPSTQESVIIAFIDPREPNILRTQNFNFFDGGQARTGVAPYIPPSTAALSIELMALEARLKQFHRHVEEALQQCLPPDFSKMYFALQQALIQKQRLPTPGALEELGLASAHYASAVSDSFIANFSVTKQLPDFRLLRALHDESKLIFSQDVLGIASLADNLVDRAANIPEISYEQFMTFRDGMTVLHSGNEGEPSQDHGTALDQETQEVL